MMATNPSTTWCHPEAVRTLLCNNLRDHRHCSNFIFIIQVERIAFHHHLQDKRQRKCPMPTHSLLHPSQARLIAAVSPHLHSKHGTVTCISTSLAMTNNIMGLIECAPLHHPASLATHHDALQIWPSFGNRACPERGVSTGAGRATTYVPRLLRSIKAKRYPTHSSDTNFLSNRRSNLCVSASPSLRPMVCVATNNADGWYDSTFKKD